MNFDGESILFDDLGADTTSLPMVINLAHNTSIEGDVSHSSIAGTVEDVPNACIVTPTDHEEVSTMIDLICYWTSYATN